MRDHLDGWVTILLAVMLWTGDGGLFRLGIILWGVLIFIWVLLSLLLFYYFTFGDMY